MSSVTVRTTGRTKPPFQAFRAVRAATRTRVIAARAVAVAKRRMRMRRRNIRTAGFLGIEKKFYDTSLGATAIVATTDATGAELDPSATSMISTPAQGDGEQNRDGKKINITAIEVKGRVDYTAQANLTALPSAIDVAVYLVLDRQTNAAQMNSEDCFKNTAASALANGSIVRNLLFNKRFKVLRVEKFNISMKAASWDGTNIEGAGRSHLFEWFIPTNIPVNFNAGTTASVANVQDNSLHIIAYATDTGTRLLYNARIRFVG